MKQCIASNDHTIVILSQRLRAVFEASSLSQPSRKAPNSGREDDETASWLCLWTLFIGMLATYRRSKDFDWMQTEARKLMQSLSLTSRDEVLAKLHDFSPAGSLPESDFVDMVLKVFAGAAIGAAGSYQENTHWATDSWYEQIPLLWEASSR